MGKILKEIVRDQGQTDKTIMLHNETLSKKLDELGISRTQAFRYRLLTYLEDFDKEQTSFQRERILLDDLGISDIQAFRYRMVNALANVGLKIPS